MIKPEFSKQTIDILARRARFQCSNPDCGVQTIGPHTQEEKSTSIGEAAHIFGANFGAARYDENVSITTRSAITNGIWLCRNCHAEIDRDQERFPSDLLFTWRKKHEERVLKELGTRGDIIRYELELERLHKFKDYPKLIYRIAIDKPKGWEWQLGAELLRYLNEPELSRLRNLREGYYFRAQSRITADNFLGWVTERTHIMSKLLAPFTILFDRLIKSFGAPGESGNIEEINNTCLLIKDVLSEVVNHEEN